ncbi:Stu2p NDAI_0C03100 [Naumovozyma dairenensis CBS 421]|uniref:TOG domain-containing protein n=1 Tax=Naumovozyma dairenensis (strain ATCC 10597 / BCRC 20456 / CBS 421 / NBRC 0211 / NRRL Y-12639) TaxID=1071378 RepID=G0W859_NAUDC|nr:hypothetical protein NDAI_0C03100 [Naumovozyma dairenensis CBS 421]CCD23970.1 hypothetical protein NDAI_0C03100 [Naumovozyma dairenensis CBS 421]
MNQQPDEDNYSELPLLERLQHKVWKARLNGYQELKTTLLNYDNIERNPNKDPELTTFWRDPSLFNKFITDSNVVAQENAILALEALILTFKPYTSTKHATTALLPTWIPSLVEKGMSSNRATTKNKSLECIMLLASLDTSISLTLELILTIFNNNSTPKKIQPPKLLVGALICISELIKSYGLINVQIQTMLPQLVTPLITLANHADKNVRAETLNLIVNIFNTTGRNKLVLQDLLLDHLKPIQQRDLDKLFEKSSAQPQLSTRLFEWQRREIELEKQRKAKQEQLDAQSKLIDNDGDTDMDMNANTNMRSSNATNNIDPFVMLPEETILDKLPEDFNSRITSSKWKDRVEVLEEFYDTTLTKVKKLRFKNQDYSHLLNIYANIIQKDPNVQAVTLASDSVFILCEKLRTPGFNKHYLSIVFLPLLERTKERKPSVIESIRKALKLLCQFYNPLNSNGNNEDMLHEITTIFMKHKTPQVRLENSTLFKYVLENSFANGNNPIPLLTRHLNEDIIPSVVHIVNDTQPNIRSIGFECLAILIKILGMRPLNETMEKLDNQEKEKIESLIDTLPSFTIRKTSSSSLSSANANSTPTSTTLIKRPNSLVPPIIPSKRSATSPLKKTNLQPKSRVLLTSRSLTMPETPSTAAPHSQPSTRMPLRSNDNGNTSKLNTELRIQLDKLENEKKKWIEERQSFLERINSLENVKLEMNKEIEILKEQSNKSQSDLYEKNLQLRSKELQINRSQDKITHLENELKRLQQQQQQQQKPQNQFNIMASPSLNNHINDNNIRTEPTVHNNISPSINNHANNSKINTTPYERRRLSTSSDDLPRRVDSLQLDSSSSDLSSNLIKEESWKRAAEVTKQLKARIQRNENKE